MWANQQGRQRIKERWVQRYGKVKFDRARGPPHGDVWEISQIGVYHACVNNEL